MLSQENIEKNIKTDICGKNVKYMYEVDSTNEEIKRMAAESDDGLLVVADAQIKGKGRLGRKWESPHNNDIYMSLLIKRDISPVKAPMVTIVAAMSVLDTIKKYTEDVYIKWPNDIVVNGKKICGILTEMKSNIYKTEYVIVGIGINVNGDTFAEDIKDKATSLYLETKKHQDRVPIIADVMASFEKYFKAFMETGDLSLLVDDYNEKLININRKVEIIENSEKYTAIALGINEVGELLVKKEGSDEITPIISGEVSVRGVYGYV